MKARTSILLALLLLFSTVGIAKTTHVCMGHEMESVIGFGKKLLNCGMELPNKNSTSKDPSSCCENKTQHLQVDDDFQLTKVAFQLTPLFIQPVLPDFILEINFFSSQKETFCNENSPPGITRDFQLLYQSFLI